MSDRVKNLYLPNNKYIRGVMADEETYLNVALNFPLHYTQGTFTLNNPLILVIDEISFGFYINNTNNRPCSGNSAGQYGSFIINSVNGNKNVKIYNRTIYSGVSVESTSMYGIITGGNPYDSAICESSTVSGTVAYFNADSNIGYDQSTGGTFYEGQLIDRDKDLHYMYKAYARIKLPDTYAFIRVESMQEINTNP